MSTRLTSEEAQLYFFEIASGRRYLKVRNGSGREFQGYMNYPSQNMQMEGRRIYFETMREAKEDKVRTREELEADVIARLEVFSEREKAELKEIDAQRTVIRAQLKKLSFAHSSIIEKKKEELRDFDTRYYEISYKRDSFYQLTAEYLAEQAEVSFYAKFCVPCIWKTPEEYVNERDDMLRGLVISHLISFIRSFDQGTLRAIARESEVRIKWRASKKTGAPFFGIPMSGGSQMFTGPTAGWTRPQTHLVSWLMYYDDVTEAYQAPDWLLNDDTKLDEWVEKKSKEKEMERNKNAAGNKGSGMQDLFVFGEEKEILFSEGSPYLAKHKEAVAKAERSSGNPMSEAGDRGIGPRKR